MQEQDAQGQSERNEIIDIRLTQHFPLELLPRNAPSQAQDSHGTRITKQIDTNHEPSSGHAEMDISSTKEQRDHPEQIRERKEEEREPKEPDTLMAAELIELPRPEIDEHIAP